MVYEFIKQRRDMKSGRVIEREREREREDERTRENSIATHS